jgi:hypothetical protein
MGLLTYDRVRKVAVFSHPIADAIERTLGTLFFVPLTFL